MVRSYIEMLAFSCRTPRGKVFEFLQHRLFGTKSFGMMHDGIRTRSIVIDHRSVLMPIFRRSDHIECLSG